MLNRLTAGRVAHQKGRLLLWFHVLEADKHVQLRKEVDRMFACSLGWQVFMSMCSCLQQVLQGGCVLHMCYMCVVCVLICFIWENFIVMLTFLCSYAQIDYLDSSCWKFLHFLESKKPQIKNIPALLQTFSQPDVWLNQSSCYISRLHSLVERGTPIFRSRSGELHLEQLASRSHSRVLPVFQVREHVVLGCHYRAELRSESERYLFIAYDRTRCHPIFQLPV